LGRGTRNVEASHQVHVDHHFPVDVGHAVENAVAQDAGVVDDAVDAAEVLERGPDHALGAGRIRHAVGIRGGAAAGAADLADDRFGRTGLRALAFGLAAATVYHHPPPFPPP